ncbi:MAG: dihydroorotase [Dehalogenimonas sp.]|jgi:dihydroorotase|uniref:Dihydroorotase n=1 Tax=Candidatus Dehalogenimonas loeffleri TaxID=3127115 RepID=A0ABZ2J3I3_9CHLR|nr:dihydroorotase [Dehalogenimonas sp.]
MKNILITNGRLIDPALGIDGKLDVALAGGKVVWTGNGHPPEGQWEIIEAEGKIVAPGFIDLHCHLRQPGSEHKETIATGTQAAARGGFTTVCAMPNTDPPIDNQVATAFILNTTAAEGAVRVLPIGCISRGRRGEQLAELGEMAEFGVIGFSDDGSSVPSARLLKQAMEYASTLGLPVLEHCEEMSLAEGGQVNEGIIATRLGLAGIPNAAEDIIVARDIALARLTGARLHLCHISTRGAVSLIRQAKAEGIRVSAEVTPHHLTLTEARCLNYETNAKVNPPLRTSADVEALIAGLIDGTIDAVATDHAPHTDNDKCCEFNLAPFGISGLETAFGSLMKLVHTGRVPLELIIEKLTAAPARIIGGLHGITGSLKPGDPADVVILDPNAEWTVDISVFVSKGRNTPLAGEQLKGQVALTIYGGKIIYQAD